ncbi:MAG: hypothetical protein QW261_11920 [Candidatus Jordarchaeaceae archaeon]
MKIFLGRDNFLYVKLEAAKLLKGEYGKSKKMHRSFGFHFANPPFKLIKKDGRINNFLP